MPPRSSDHDRPQTKFMFVGGPSFNAHRSGNLRSTLLRRVLSERRVKRRQDAADKLDHILKGQGDPPAFCSCAQESESSAEASGYRPIKPRNEQSLDPARGSDTGRDGCSTCGGLLPPSAPASRGQASRVPSPQPLGTGSYDPLLPVDPVASGLKVQELLHFAVTVIWPHFRPLSYAGDCYHSWVFPVENNVQLYAILWASSYHRDVLRVTYGREPQLDSKEQLQLKGLALKSLQAELANISGSSPLDGVVMCVLYLAVNERYMTKVFRDPSPFCPPFQNLHALDFYGSRDYHPLHWNVVQDIIQRFGGIEVLQAFALAWLVSISGLMNAIHTLQKPVYPILGVDGKRLDLPPHYYYFTSTVGVSHTIPRGWDFMSFCTSGRL
ncbi:hypothetical protein AOCH_006985 [Aspergillus ochraceoroseus]|uniref:Uncharacterized protein n=1 Tax=Aspergillus ochraceoroseus TaxID=138278 RepID=A0A0F8V000_9EURO|nr:hypothetical protein AOCH_006985 [Aspergillus ochraceoroseus]